jgi:hypothetical protein
VFHWQKAGDGFVGTIGDLPVFLQQDNELLKVRFGGPPKPTGPRPVIPGIAATTVRDLTA